jgi:hypothetical protein
LFNGEYYHQMLPAPDDYQLGEGCISEQVHGQHYARMLGLEDIYHGEHIHRALESLLGFSFCDNFYDHLNTGRAYSVGGDCGLLIATGVALAFQRRFTLSSVPLGSADSGTSFVRCGSAA